jgi:tetraprenyl-beta-curcumene synthase
VDFGVACRRRPVGGSCATAVAFASSARRYWLGVFPAVRLEVRRLRRCAEAIPDPTLRGLALDAQRRKWASLEGAAAFAVFVPRARRTAVARLLVDLQAIFDYADTLMEQSCAAPVANARQLHTAFLAAFDQGEGHLDYYAHHPCHGDGGYLIGLVQRCRRAVRTLPSYALVADAVRRNAWRIIFYQAVVNLASPEGYDSLARWSREQVPADADIEWWEVAAAAGSSLVVFALLAAAAKDDLQPAEVEDIEQLYWPWAESLHIFLDSLVDRAEDLQSGQPSLLDHYRSRPEMARRLSRLTAETFRRAERVERQHRLILAAMVALYLSDAQAWTPFARPVAERILTAADCLVAPALLLLRARRLALH